MKRSLLLLSTLFIISSIQAQDPDIRFGRITQEELEMTVYQPDTAAVAVVLYEDINIVFDMGSDGRITKRTNVSTKIKILKSEGTKWGDISVPYYVGESSREEVNIASAASYNLENGKMKKSMVNMMKNNVHDEITTMTRGATVVLHRAKCSIPDVKAGSVVEYKYTLTSGYISYLDDIVIQKPIPVVFSNVRIAIPQWYTFHVKEYGSHPMDVQTSNEAATATRVINYRAEDWRGTGSVDYIRETFTEDYTLDIISCKARDIPATKKEPRVWCPEEHIDKLSFEFIQLSVPNSTHIEFASNWKSVYSTLKTSNFDKGIKISNPYKEETRQICEKYSDEMERIAALHQMVLGKMTWNGRYGVSSGAPRQAIKEGRGNSAEINYIICAVMGDAGFNVEPLLLSTRSRGRLHSSPASLDMLVTFVVRVPVSGGKYVYLDGTSKHSAPNVLPLPVLTDMARIYTEKDDYPASPWVDLTSIAENVSSSEFKVKVGADGVIKGFIEENKSGQCSMTNNVAWEKDGSREKYIERREGEDNIKIEEYVRQTVKPGVVNEKYDFMQSAGRAGDFFYVPATVLPFMSKNSLTQTERMFPLEFSYPVKYVIKGSVEIPEGYQVEELPADKTFTAESGGMSFSYSARKTSANTIDIVLTHEMKRIIYPTETYRDIQAFFDRMVEANNAMIVLKKI